MKKYQLKLLVGFLFIGCLIVSAKAQNKCRDLPEKFFGVTTEKGDFERGDKNFDLLVNPLKEMKGANLPVIRIVFQHGDSPSAYLKLLETLHGKKPDCSDRIAYVMGLLVDSQQMYNFNDKHRGNFPRDYKNDIVERAKTFTKELGDYVDIWEIGNEMNGTWVGWKDDEELKEKSPIELALMRQEVGKEIIDVYDFFIKYKNSKGIQPKLALNLFFYKNTEGKNCFEFLDKCQEECIQNYDMLQWADNNLRKLSGGKEMPRFDYVFFSYYEEECDGVPTTMETWTTLFKRQRERSNAISHSIFRVPRGWTR